MKILVCGGRDFTDYVWLGHVLDALKAHAGVALIISGAARGADTLAVEWANSRGIPTRLFPADWEAFGKKAGPIRNQQMLTEGKPDLVVAFPGDRGTADMIERAKRAKVPTNVMQKVHPL